MSAISVRDYSASASSGAPVLQGTVTDGYGVASMAVQVFPPSGAAYTETVLVTGDTWSYTPVFTETVLGRYRLQVTAVDLAGNSSNLGPFVLWVQETQSEPPKVYLPLVVRAAPQPPPAETFPDLVGSITLSPDQRSFAAGEPVQITVEVTNQGDAATENGFWVELYINPAEEPAVNQSWDSLCGLWPCHGIVWGVSDSLAPGESITLTSEAGSYTDLVTIWPGWFINGTSDLYLLVDSWNCDEQGEQCVATGVEQERDETNNLTHLGGLTVTGENPPQPTIQTEALPIRPSQPEKGE
jgi:hypothetical protein